MAEWDNAPFFLSVSPGWKGIRQTGRDPALKAGLTGRMPVKRSSVIALRAFGKCFAVKTQHFSRLGFVSSNLKKNLLDILPFQLIHRVALSKASLKKSSFSRCRMDAGKSSGKMTSCLVRAMARWMIFSSSSRSRARSSSKASSWPPPKSRKLPFSTLYRIFRGNAELEEGYPLFCYEEAEVQYR